MREHSFRGVVFKTACERALNDMFEDEQEVRDRHWHINPGDVVVDVGSGVGSYALPALALGASVMAFGPDPVHTHQFTTNLALNEGFRERCELFSCGLYDRVGWLAVGHMRKIEKTSSTPTEDHYVEWHEDRYIFSEVAPESPDQFQVGPFDQFQLSRVDWLKIDVEGSELAVLKGAEQTIRCCKPKLLVENHQFMDKMIESSVIQFIDDLNLGYSVKLSPHHGVSHSFFEVT